MSIRCDIYDRKQYDIWFAAAPYAAASKPAKSLKQWAADEKADVVLQSRSVQHDRQRL